MQKRNSHVCQRPVSAEKSPGISRPHEQMLQEGVEASDGSGENPRRVTVVCFLTGKPHEKSDQILIRETKDPQSTTGWRKADALPS
ncbi:hypothetical protein RRG08_000459 [Elysia crispata]|uniref:Uncharacterized protein n=1 Tax=Elysia crispata TaxID=231223 RepID=A0AAE0YCG4_9GAST|nr:hypothetical protein RRG08_000459 [Elysia crispata]